MTASEDGQFLPHGKTGGLAAAGCAVTPLRTARRRRRSADRSVERRTRVTVAISATNSRHASQSARCDAAANNSAGHASLSSAADIEERARAQPFPAIGVLTCTGSDRRPTGPPRARAAPPETADEPEPSA